MRATQVIQVLQELITEHGDLDVVRDNFPQPDDLEELFYSEVVHVGRLYRVFEMRLEGDE